MSNRVRLIIFYLSLLASHSYAASKTDADVMAEVTFIPQLNSKLPHTYFNSIRGKVNVTELISSSTSILTFSWFNCENLCGLILNGLADSSAKVLQEQARDFQVIVVSMDHEVSVEQLKIQKKHLAQQYPKAQINKRWHFLSGSAESIRALADAVGYHFTYDERKAQFAHPAGIVAVSKGAYIRDFRSGINYRAEDLKQLLSAADSEAPAGPKASPLLLLCYDYDPSSGKYSLAITKLLRVLALGVLIGLVGAMYYWQRKHKGTP